MKMTTMPVLVPVELHALVVNSHPRLFVRNTRNYALLSAYQTPDTLTFASSESAMQNRFGGQENQRGVYLMWTLPAALRKGRRDHSGTLTFPLVPNRWLVRRTSGPAENRATAVWVVESDYIGKDGSSPFVEPETAHPVATRIGCHSALPPGAVWTPRSASRPSFLTSVGVGDTAFAHYQPGMEDVFSFHDVEAKDLPAGSLGYTVVGWYSDPTADVLASAPADLSLADRLAVLDWSVSGTDGLDAASVYHGTLFGVRWDPVANTEPSACKTAAIKVAIGNTAIDALCAMVEAAGKDEVDVGLLEAFQYGLLDAINKPGGDGLVDAAKRRAWFSARPAGVVWETVDRESGDAKPKDVLSPSALDAETRLLKQLNDDQRAYDARMRELRTLRRRLVEIWWKAGFAAWNRVDVEKEKLAALLDEKGADGLPAKIAGVMVELSTLATRLPSGEDADALARALDRTARNAGLDASRVLKGVPDHSFHQPLDPVLLISGVNHDYDPFATDGALACRRADELVAALKVAGPSGTSLEIGRDRAATSMPPFNPANMPAVVADLLAEGFLLDPDNAPQLTADDPGGASADVVAALRRAQAAPCATTAGVAPALGLTPWAPPWLPLFVDWEVNYYRLPSENWEFDGQDYRWTGSGAGGPPEVYSGRSVMTPQPAFVFGRRLQKFIDDHSAAVPGLAALAAKIAEVARWDYLAQTMTGLTTWIALRDPRVHRAPDDTKQLTASLTMASLIGDAPPPVPQSLGAKAPHHQQPAPWPFDGTRAGQFTISHLRVVDRFGQCLDVMGPEVVGSPKPIIAAELRPEKTALLQDADTFVQLPPRLIQDARIAFNFVDPQGGDVRPGDPGNPVAGWLVPNHLEQGLAAYDAEGEFLGELRPVVDADGATALTWSGGVNGGAAGLEEIARNHPDLGGLLMALMRRDYASYDTFLTVIDETMWTVDPLGERHDRVVSSLIGRPLALVRASLALEVAEDPLTETSWPFTLEPAASGLPNLRFPVRLGDLGRRADGLVGYFAGSYDQFNSVHDPAGAVGAAASFVRPAGPGSYLSLAVDEAPQILTLLVDPRASVSVTSGILPLAEVRIPSRHIAPVLERMAVAVRAGPVLGRLSPAPPAEPGGPPALALTLPVPATRGGAWSWRQPGPVPTQYALAPVDQRASFQAAATLRDGFLQFSRGMNDDD